ncbi:hypothetical protein J4760_07980 [Salinicoccus sp. ID82-1]|uniref:hypothetical protein n=1 Tax=Salinicoccus sp. ID82-1 TaxID=2820269 RepID=UPI001F3B74A4|nr:hypothetical protein [Salinicoccus sp. ID82-1]MCG1009955.1 hypothetical protein [Salinicoccus sp. ID82-1]
MVKSRIVTVQSTELKKVKLPFNRQTQLEVLHEGRTYHFLLYLRKRTDHLLVMSNGAINPVKKRPPVFMRSTWTDSLPGSLIFIDDPTLHGTDLRLGWGQGTRDQFALEVISNLIDTISEMLKYDRSQIFFYGSSAGGFMSLMYATMLAGTTAIVNNPQTNVLRYYATSSDPLIRHVYGILDRGIMMEQYGHRLSVAEAFSHYGNVPRIHYFQNTLCLHDMRNHLEPLIAEMEAGGLDMSQLYVHHYFDAEAGHRPLSKAGTERILHSVLVDDLDYHV